METIRSRVAVLTADLPSAYWFLWLGILNNRLGSFVIPFLTLYLTTQRGVSVSQAALTVSLFGAGSFAAQLTGGELADRFGRRPVLLMSLFIAPVAMLALGFAHAPDFNLVPQPAPQRVPAQEHRPIEQSSRRRSKIARIFAARNKQR